MTKGVERVLRDALRASLRHPKEAAFMARFASSVKKAGKLRAQEEAAGLHVPPFLICSITSRCNLHCAGCYSRANHATTDCAPESQMEAAEWEAVFQEATELGISFILLAGGEPLLRRDVIEAAGRFPEILFPIFTNGVFLTENCIGLFDRSRNLLPVISIEGGKDATDHRRGNGIHEKVMANMDLLHARGIFFGCSITVTTENLAEVCAGAFIEDLSSRGCRAVFFIEFVPVTEESRDLAPGDTEREQLASALSTLRETYPQVVFVSFPGDEKTSDGCIAAGRGFFHINSQGGAEPCPFSPYSDVNVRGRSLKEAIQSPLFHRLVDQGALKEDHAGGCVLFERRDQVEAILAQGVPHGA